MSSPVTAPASQRLTLPAGQALRQRMARGTVVHVESGRINVRLPFQWLAQTAWRPEHPMSAGNVLVIEASGWLEITGEAQAVIEVRPPAASAWRRGLWRIRGVWAHSSHADNATANSSPVAR
ncbi:hypothetical protein [Paraburkholderia adhaesiva]|uniref:hypothetical protein n=1 Tax=Paraburkholderia adhaesiva TaxID=2883244 RepID=UPI001F454289|nr:hypothetical protein [Paraburkholderia adhaesiva]